MPSIIKTLSVGVVLVNRNFQALSNHFVVRTAANAIIDEMKEDLHKKWAEDPSNDPSEFYPVDVLIWRLKDRMVIQNPTPERIKEKLGQIDVKNTKDTMDLLWDEDIVAHLGLLPDEILIAQPPIGGPTTKDVDLEYGYCFFKAWRGEDFTKGDVELNGIDADNVGAPKFVQCYEELSRRKRKVAAHIRKAAEMLLGSDGAIFEDYFCSTPEAADIVRRPEVIHLVHILSVDPQTDSETLQAYKPRDFTKCDAYWLFFSVVAKYYEALTSVDDEAKIIVKRHLESWPFQLLVRVAGQYHTYTPESDFLVLRSNLPRLAVEVDSHAQTRPRVRFSRLMLQGASVVRFANTKLDAYKKEKSFVFVAIFISATGLVERYFLYQNEKKDPYEVYWRQRTFSLENKRDRLVFALELYNLSSAWHADEGDTKGQVRKLSETVSRFSTENNLPSFAHRSKRFSSDYRGDDEQLENAGYEIVPDVLETKGGTWELLEKLPPYLRTVYRRDDPNKTEYIAKHVREGSNELAIHEYLRTRQSHSPHVISLIEAIPSTTREWLIQPKLHSIRNQWFINGGDVAGRVRLGCGLVKGLGYLHEHKIAHRDIKPDNLVCDKDYELKIIDFDLAIEVQDENTKIVEYCGTEGWTAPEVGTQRGPALMYSPIKADRWSCGRVLLHHIMVGIEDHLLLKIAGQLMTQNPRLRPSLLECHKLLVPPISKITNVRDGRYEEDGGEDVKPPDAKKPRLE